MGELERRMTEAEFVQWQVYAGHKGFPFRRIEFHLANIARIIAATMGGQEDATLKDYLLDPIKSTQDTEENLDAAKEAFGFAPRK